MLRVGVVTAFPQADWHSARLIREVGLQGAEPVVLDPASFAAVATARGLRLLANGEDLAALDALLLVRGMSPHGDPETQFEVYQQLLALGQPQLNRIDALLAAQDKVRTTLLLARAGVPTPATVVAQTVNEALAALETLGRAVLKPRFGSLGDGLRRLRWDARGREAVEAAVRRGGAVYLQRYVETGGLDYRVFVVAGRARGAVARRARRGEWRTNMSRGGTVEPCEAPGALLRAAVGAARAVGLDYTAVDLVLGSEGPQVLEVNGHPNFEGLWRAGGADIGARVVELVLRRARARRRPGGQHKDPAAPAAGKDWAAMAPSA